MALVYDRPQEVADWVAAQDGNAAPTADAAIGFDLDGRLIGGVYFDGHAPNNIFAHIAVNGQAVPRSLIKACGQYVYRQLDLERMTFAVASNNERAIRLMDYLGAEYEGRLKRACGDADLLLFVLWRSSPAAIDSLTD